MSFEDLQKAWQSQDAGAKVTVSADALLKEVRRNQRQFRAMILWRDVREVLAAVFVAWAFGDMAVRSHAWVLYLSSAACLGVAVFLLVDRWRQRKNRPVTNNPLRACLEASLLQVKHQIWLLKNVVWWYLLPLAIASALCIVGVAWAIPLDELKGRPELKFKIDCILLGSFAVAALICGVVFWFIYWLNQRAVRTGLDPRRQELETLLAGLDENSQ